MSLAQLVIACPSHRGVSVQTQSCIVEAQVRGARLVSLCGVGDVALARNQTLTLALARKESADVCLFVDDDMVFEIAAVEKLVQLARTTGEAWSAAYATASGKLAATRFDWNPNETERYMVGLGLCAVPFAKLEQLAAELGTISGPDDKPLIPFCQCAVVTPEHDNTPRWCSEDYWLCRSLGGVRMAPYVSAGHLKTVPLWPDEHTLAFLAGDKPRQPLEVAEAQEAEAPSKKPARRKSRRRKKAPDAPAQAVA